MEAIGIGILALCAWPLAVAAQENENLVMEEITVTAQKRAQSLQDVPISVQAITESAIRELGATVISDLEASAPSLQTGGAIGTSNQRMGIRGIVDYSRNTGVDARMGIYIDGVYQGRSYSSDQPLLGLERVEILRGPQGTLFGKNTVSGALSLVTKTPTEEFEGGGLCFRRAGRDGIRLPVFFLRRVGRLLLQHDAGTGHRRLRPLGDPGQAAIRARRQARDHTGGRRGPVEQQRAAVRERRPAAVYEPAELRG